MSTSRYNILESIGYWLAELVVIFIGAYLAFLLNGHRIHRQHEHKKQQIYAALYQYFSRLHIKKPNSYFQNKYVAQFLKPYREKKMPRLKKPVRHLILSINDKSWNVMLQAGGFNLLNIKFINQINYFFTTFQREREMTQHFNKMTDKYLLPHYNDSLSTFYNTKSKKLKPQYEWYVNYITFTQSANRTEVREVGHILKTLKQKMNKKQLQKIRADSGG